MEGLYDVAVIGGGIAGFSAALSAKSLGLRCLWLGDALFGDKIKRSEYIRNYPAFLGDGVRFYEELTRQMQREGVGFTRGRADGVFRMKENFSVSAAPQVYAARTVILCTGVDLKGGLKGEGEFLGRGLSYCAVCDGALYRGKKIAAVLSSPSLSEDVEYLAGFADEVTVFANFDVSFTHENVRICHDIPRGIEGEGRVGRLVCEGGTYAVDGVFLLRSALPPAVLCGGVKTDGPHVAVDRNMATNIPGLFAAGDVTGLPYQYAKAAGEGLVAAHAAKRYLTARAS